MAFREGKIFVKIGVANTFTFVVASNHVRIHLCMLPQPHPIRKYIHEGKNRISFNNSPGIKCQQDEGSKKRSYLLENTIAVLSCQDNSNSVVIVRPFWMTIHLKKRIVEKVICMLGDSRLRMSIGHHLGLRSGMGGSTKHKLIIQSTSIIPWNEISSDVIS